jgi:hypothetical protein
MTDSHKKPGIIPRNAVRIGQQPVLVDCGSTSDGQRTQPLAVVPLLDGDRVAGFEVRCGCGAAAVVECVYAAEPKPPAPTPEPTS